MQSAEKQADSQPGQEPKREQVEEVKQQEAAAVEKPYLAICKQCNHQEIVKIPEKQEHPDAYTCSKCQAKSQQPDLIQARSPFKPEEIQRMTEEKGKMQKAGEPPGKDQGGKQARPSKLEPVKFYVNEIERYGYNDDDNGFNIFKGHVNESEYMDMSDTVDSLLAKIEKKRLELEPFEAQLKELKAKSDQLKKEREKIDLTI